MIRTIIFDLGKTLIPFHFDPILERMRDCSPAVREQAERLIADFERGRVPATQFQRTMCAHVGLQPADFLPWWNSIFTIERDTPSRQWRADPLAPPPGTDWLVSQDWVRSLRPRFRVGLLSNTNAVHFAFLQSQHSLLAELDFHILSHAVGAAKPEVAIFAAAEAAAQCRPEQIFYLDDVAEYVEAARRRGWQAEVFGGEAAAQAALMRLM